MKRLTDKYEVIEEMKKNNRIIYRTRDHFNNTEVFIEKHKEIKNSDWNTGTKVNEELRKLRLTEEIDDYFYYDNQEKKTKIFFRVYLENILEEKIKKETKKKTRLKKHHSDEEETLVNFSNNEKSTSVATSNNDFTPKKKVKNLMKLERVMVCENCRTEVNLRNFDNLTNTTFCEVCKSKHKIIFEEKGSKKETSQKSRYIDIKKNEDELLIEITKSKIGMIFSLMLIIPLAAFYLSDAEYLFETFETYLAIGAVIVLVIMILDKNYIEIRNGALLTYSKPFSTSKAQKFAVRDIKQLYVRKKLAEGAGEKTRIRFNNGRAYNETYYKDAEADLYNLIVILKGNDEFSILETYNSSDALYLEKTIEEYLKIQDIDIAKEI